MEECIFSPLLMMTNLRQELMAADRLCYLAVDYSLVVRRDLHSNVKEFQATCVIRSRTCERRLRTYSQRCIEQSTTLRGIYSEEPVCASAIFDKADTDLTKQIVPSRLAELCSPVGKNWIAYRHTVVGEVLVHEPNLTESERPGREPRHLCFVYRRRKHS